MKLSLFNDYVQEFGNREPYVNSLLSFPDIAYFTGMMIPIRTKKYFNRRKSI